MSKLQRELEEERLETESLVLSDTDIDPQPRKDRLGPAPGTYAATARAMARIYPDFDWDKWKDETKDALGTRF